MHCRISINCNISVFLHFFTHTGWCKLFHFLNFVELWVYLKITKNLKAISINFSSSLFLSFPVCVLLKNMTCLYLFSIVWELTLWWIRNGKFDKSIMKFYFIFFKKQSYRVCSFYFTRSLSLHIVVKQNFWSNFRYRCEVQFLSTACILGSYVVNVNVYDA